MIRVGELLDRSNTMKTLSINQAQAAYTATFAFPAFGLWQSRQTLTEHLYNTLSPFGATLNDIRYELSDRMPGGTAVVVNTPDLSAVRLKLDGMEWAIGDFDDEDLLRVPDMLEGLAALLRSQQKDFEFKSHIINYSNHSKLSEGTAKEYLNSLPNKPLQTVGENLGTGVIYQWLDADLGWQVQMVVTSSLALTDGLFVQCIVSLDHLAVEYPALVETVTRKLDAALAEMGLEIEREVEDA